MLTTRPVMAAELARLTPALATMFRAVVHAGAPLGFLEPPTEADAERYWRSLLPELRAGRRVVLVAFLDGRVAGAGQLAFPRWPNARHRAELQKLFVDPALRGQGIGQRIVVGLHDEAHRDGRSLILLNTRAEGPTRAFYRRLGYREVGLIPGYALTPDGARYADVSMYQELTPRPTSELAR